MFSLHFFTLSNDRANAVFWVSTPSIIKVTWCLDWETPPFSWLHHGSILDILCVILYKFPPNSAWHIWCVGKLWVLVVWLLEKKSLLLACFMNLYISLCHWMISCCFRDTHTAVVWAVSLVAPVESKSGVINRVIQRLSAALYKCVLHALALDWVWGLCCVYSHACRGLAAVQRAQDCSSPSSGPACRQDLLGLITILSRNDRWRL